MAMSLEKTYAVIPCYNEEARIRQTVEDLLKLGLQVVVVDDGSEDGTCESLAGLPVHYLRHCINLGQGAALQTGMEYCRLLGAEAVVHFDADGQHSPDDIPAFLDALSGCDIVLGSRFLRKEDRRNVPFMKRALLRCARVVNFLFTGLWLSDAHNGLRALGPRAIGAIDLDENRMAHATEILMRIRKARLKYRELPCSIRYTDYSRGKGQRWYNSINILIDLILNRLFF